LKSSPAISAYLCDVCVTVVARNILTQRSQRYAEIAEKNQLVVKTTFRARPLLHIADFSLHWPMENVIYETRDETPMSIRT
jgi:hypothetical protein